VPHYSLKYKLNMLQLQNLHINASSTSLKY
jgi:hypothetical protein